MWDIQQISLYRQCNVSMVSELTGIWKTTTLISKEKSQAVVEISCLHRLCEMRYKAPRITHIMVVLILGLIFHI